MHFLAYLNETYQGSFKKSVVKRALANWLGKNYGSDKFPSQEELFCQYEQSGWQCCHLLMKWYDWKSHSDVFDSLICDLLSKQWVECIGLEIVLFIIFLLPKRHNEVWVSLREQLKKKSTSVTMIRSSLR